MIGILIKNTFIQKLLPVPLHLWKQFFLYIEDFSYKKLLQRATDRSNVESQNTWKLIDSWPNKIMIVILLNRSFSASAQDFLLFLLVCILGKNQSWLKWAICSFYCLPRRYLPTVALSVCVLDKFHIHFKIQSIWIF